MSLATDSSPEFATLVAYAREHVSLNVDSAVVNAIDSAISLHIAHLEVTRDQWAQDSRDAANDLRLLERENVELRRELRRLKDKA